MARNAENEAVPPPISKYGTLFGISDERDGFLMITLNFLSVMN